MKSSNIHCGLLLLIALCASIFQPALALGNNNGKKNIFVAAQTASVTMMFKVGIFLQYTYDPTPSYMSEQEINKKIFRERLQMLDKVKAVNQKFNVSRLKAEDLMVQRPRTTLENSFPHNSALISEEYSLIQFQRYLQEAHKTYMKDRQIVTTIDESCKISWKCSMLQFGRMCASIVTYFIPMLIYHNKQLWDTMVTSMSHGYLTITYWIYQICNVCSRFALKESGVSIGVCFICMLLYRLYKKNQIVEDESLRLKAQLTSAEKSIARHKVDAAKKNILIGEQFNTNQILKDEVAALKAQLTSADESIATHKVDAVNKKELIGEQGKTNQILKDEVARLKAQLASADETIARHKVDAASTNRFINQQKKENQRLQIEITRSNPRPASKHESRTRRVRLDTESHTNNTSVNGGKKPEVSHKKLYDKIVADLEDTGSMDIDQLYLKSVVDFYESCRTHEVLCLTNEIGRLFAAIKEKDGRDRPTKKNELTNYLLDRLGGEGFSFHHEDENCRYLHNKKHKQPIVCRREIVGYVQDAVSKKSNKEIEKQPTPKMQV